MLALEPLVWYDPSDATTITQADGLVSRMEDKSGNGHDQIQATSGNRPGWGQTQNGLSVLGGAVNASVWMQASESAASAFNALHNGTKVLIAGVFNPGVLNTGKNGWFGNGDRNNAVNGIAVQSETGATRFDSRTAASFQTFAETPPPNPFTYAAINVATIMLDLSNATAASRYKCAGNDNALTGSNASTAAVSTADAGNSLYIMRTLGGNTCAPDARFGEFIIVTGANATEENRIALRDYLNDKWAVY